MAKKTRNEIRVFIASPGDLLEERRAFKDVIDDLNKGFGDGCDVAFVPLGWEDTLLPAGPRSQDVINQEIETCDIFFLILNRRWGQPPKNSPYSSYTEEEFELARSRYAKQNAPIIYVFLKNIAPDFRTDPGPQLQRVLAFRKKLEDEDVFGRSFADVAEFKIELDRHLRGTIKEGQLTIRMEEVKPESPSISAEEFEKLKKEIEDLKKQLGGKSVGKDVRIQSEIDVLALAEKASTAATDGKIEQARQMFAQAVTNTTNLRVLYLAYEFYNRTGELDSAEKMMRQTLAIVDPNEPSAVRAAALGNLGLIERTRGNLDAAEKLFREVLGIFQKLGGLEGQAAALGNLGVIEQTRDNLDAAENYFKQSLEIHRKIGRPEGQARDLGNLGAIEMTRDNLDAAEHYIKQSLEINRKIGCLEGQANQLGNLGLIEQTRGNLDAAENYFKQSLEIHRKIGRPEGQANGLANLGLIERTRGNLDAAENYHKQSLEIDRKIGRLEGQANQLGNLGAIEQTRGNLDAAENYHKQSLEIERKIGRLEGQANGLANLGSIAEQRGNVAEAKRLWTEARDMFAKIGMESQRKRVQGWIDGLGGE